MPDLGKYTDTVLLAYGASLVLLLGLIALSLVQSRKIKRALRKAEDDNKNG